MLNIEMQQFHLGF